MKMVPSAALNLTDCRILRIRGLCRRSASCPASSILLLSVSLFLSLSFLLSLELLVQAEGDQRSSSHPRTDVTHQLSALQGNARTDRFCRSFHSSRPRATATLLMHARVRPYVCVRAPIGGHNSRLDQSEYSIHLLPAPTKVFSSLTLSCYCPRAHPLYLRRDLGGSFCNRVRLTFISNLMYQRVFLKIPKRKRARETLLNAPTGKLTASTANRQFLLVSYTGANSAHFVAFFPVATVLLGLRYCLIQVYRENDTN